MYIKTFKMAPLKILPVQSVFEEERLHFKVLIQEIALYLVIMGILPYIQSGRVGGKRECRYVGSALDVEYVYSQLYQQFSSSPHNLTKSTTLPPHIGSPQLEKVGGF